MHLLKDIQTLPLIFEEEIEWEIKEININKKKSSELFNFKSTQLFVLVHGYKGSSNDLRLIRNSLLIVFPFALFLLSNSNEKNTEIDITKMGENLAN